MMDDIELLQKYGTGIAEDSFASLVDRHLNLVYSSALRQVRDPQLAEDVAQTVFVLLAKKARSIRRGTILAGWLYRTTRFVSLEALRTETRRRLREQAAMEPLHEQKHRSAWDEIQPLLDEAMAALGENDRNLVLLRYFENRSLKHLGQSLGITEDAVQKRVARALEKLRAFFWQRGAVLPAAGVAGALSTFAVPSAPAGLAVALLHSTATPAALTATSILTQAILKLMAMTKIKTAALAARRDTWEAKVLAGTSDLLAIHELVQLNHNLDEPDKTLRLFDQLPSGHAARAGLVDAAAAQFTSAKRYEDIVAAGHPEAVYDREQFAMSRASTNMKTNEMLQTALRRRVVDSGGLAVEALARAGQSERALALADKVLAFDNSPETRGQLLKYAERSGNAAVVAHVKGK